MTTPATNRQVPDQSIMDHYNKQNYLGNRFNYVLSYTGAGSSEIAQILLVNPLLSTTSVQNQKSLFVDTRRVTGITTAVAYIMNCYLNPTVTSAGSSKTATNVRTGSANTSIATLTSAPTISANGTLVESLAATAITAQSSGDLFIIDPGKSLLVTVVSANAAVVNLGLSWYEI